MLRLFRRHGYILPSARTFIYNRTFHLASTTVIATNIIRARPADLMAHSEELALKGPLDLS